MIGKSGSMQFMTKKGKSNKSGYFFFTLWGRGRQRILGQNVILGYHIVDYSVIIFQHIDTMIARWIIFLLWHSL